MKDGARVKAELVFEVVVTMEYNPDRYTEEEMIEHAQWACKAYSLSGTSRSMEIVSAKLKELNK